MANFYFDTCIWRDYHEDRVDNLRPLGEWAFQLLRKVKEEGHMIYYSDLVYEELLKDYDFETINSLLQVVKENGLLSEIRIGRTDLFKAKNLQKKFGIHFSDALHAVLAKKKDAILVTRDKHFLKASQFIPVKKPEELI